MKNLGSFGPRSRPQAAADIEFCGETFTLRPVSGFVLLEVQRKSQELISLNVDKLTEEQIAANPELMAKLIDSPMLFMTVLRTALGEAQYARLVELANEYAVELDVMVDMGKAAYEWASAFPTSPQTESSELRLPDGQSVKSTYSQFLQEQNSPDMSEIPSQANTGRHAQTELG